MNTIPQQQTLEKTIKASNMSHIVETQNGDVPVPIRATTDQYQSSSNEITAHSTHQTLMEQSQTVQYLKDKPKPNLSQVANQIRPENITNEIPQQPKRKTSSSRKHNAINYLLKKFYEGDLFIY